MSVDDQETQEFVLGPAPSKGELFQLDFTPSRIDVAAATNTGKKRTENQDHYAVIRRARIQQVMLADVPMDQEYGKEEATYLLMVADGMGGVAFGEVASRAVIQTAWELTHQASSWIMKMGEVDRAEQIRRVGEYVNLLEKRLRQYAKADPRMEGMGTTITAVCIIGMDAIVAHVGDTRAYRLRDTELLPLTQDQTVEQRMLDMGSDPEEAARFHNVLTNCLGSYRSGTKAAVSHYTLQHGDRILICTDGLTDELNDEEIQSLLGPERTTQEACDALIEAALEKGGRDNVTVIVAQVEMLKGTHQDSAAWL